MTISLPDCFCDGVAPWCPVCVVATAVRMRHDHPHSLSISMLRRRIPGITGREAAFLIEATRNLVTRRNGRYVERSPTHD